MRDALFATAHVTLCSQPACGALFATCVHGALFATCARGALSQPARVTLDRNLRWRRSVATCARDARPQPTFASLCRNLCAALDHNLRGSGGSVAALDPGPRAQVNIAATLHRPRVRQARL
ncbi:hypothetical protein GCM10020218_058460 [Dactylosporangium vinaceum]